MSTTAENLSVAKTTAIIFRRLMEYYEPDQADTWLNSPHPQLEGQLPIELIARCEGGPVLDVLDRLDGDGYL